MTYSIINGRLDVTARNDEGRPYVGGSLYLSGTAITSLPADIVLDGRNVRDTLIAEGWARPYNGGPRKGWCSRHAFRAPAGAGWPCRKGLHRDSP